MLYSSILIYEINYLDFDLGYYSCYNTPIVFIMIGIAQKEVYIWDYDDNALYLGTWTQLVMNLATFNI